ncbi:uncharacterized protein LOC143825518 [Paroedura picta]|uniref:uncharacterized protein LOC143825518 n=1 Tax=Paroedura picta TaxID=143630 RepID=UPI0040561478
MSKEGGDEDREVVRKVASEHVEGLLKVGGLRWLCERGSGMDGILLKGKKWNILETSAPRSGEPGRLPPIFTNNEAARQIPPRLEDRGVGCVSLAGAGKGGPGSRWVSLKLPIREPGPLASPPAAAPPHGRPPLFPPVENTALVCRHQGLRGKSGSLQPRQGVPLTGRTKRRSAGGGDHQNRRTGNNFRWRDHHCLLTVAGPYCLLIYN